jgi:hypothetical protein
LGAKGKPGSIIARLAHPAKRELTSIHNSTGRIWTTADIAAALLKGCAALDAHEQHDGRTKGWLAAALLPLVGMEAPTSLPAAAAAVDQMRLQAMSLQKHGSWGLLAAAAAGCGDCHTATASSSPRGVVGRGAIGRTLARRRWRATTSWSHSSGGGGGVLSAGGLLPWQGALSGHNSVDPEQLQSTADVLTVS